MNAPGLRLPLLSAVLLWACQNAGAPAQPRQFLAVDLLDMQTLSGGQPMRYRLWDVDKGVSAQGAPSGPDLSLRMALSAPLPQSEVQQASTLGVVVYGPDGQPVPARTVRQDPVPSGDQTVPGATNYLTLVSDVRSDRAYTVSFDPAQLAGADGPAFAVPPDLHFQTARRFAVIRAIPPDRARLASVTQLQFTFSTPAAERASEVYGVSLTAAGAPLSIMMLMLSGDRRQLLVEPDCPLPLGQTQVDIAEGGLEEDDSLVPLLPFHETITVTQDPGPCQDMPDMAPQDG